MENTENAYVARMQTEISELLKLMNIIQEHVIRTQQLMLPGVQTQFNMHGYPQPFHRPMADNCYPGQPQQPAFNWVTQYGRPDMGLGPNLAASNVQARGSEFLTGYVDRCFNEMAQIEALVNYKRHELMSRYGRSEQPKPETQWPQGAAPRPPFQPPTSRTAEASFSPNEDKHTDQRVL